MHLSPLTFCCTFPESPKIINKKLINSVVKDMIALEKLDFETPLALNSTGLFGEFRSLFSDCFTCDKICCGCRPEWEPLCVASAPENPSSSHKLDQNVSGISFAKRWKGKGIEHNGALVQQELLIRLQVAQEVLNESAAGVARKIQGRNA